MVNPLSAITGILSFPFNPEGRASSESDVDPTNTGDTKIVAPFGVIPVLIVSFIVVCFCW